MLVEFDRSANTTEEISTRMNKRFPGLAWSESCSEIVYERGATPQSTSQASTVLYVLDVATGTVTQRVSNARSATWRATGVAFVQNDDIWLYYAGGSTRQLTTASGPGYHPVLFDQQSGESLAYNHNTGTASNPNASYGRSGESTSRARTIANHFRLTRTPPSSISREWSASSRTHLRHIGGVFRGYRIGESGGTVDRPLSARVVSTRGPAGRPTPSLYYRERLRRRFPSSRTTGCAGSSLRLRGVPHEL